MSKDLSNLELPRDFVVIEDLPMMGTGKINFRAVGEMVKEMMK
jgi:acyl-[acyl-carrier-protein]-phospholipid O-acyltransferase/long-chain-fatty-acid--[acyl-carrier-protein] ligase